MEITPEEYLKRKRISDQKARDADRAEGIADRYRAEAKEEFGCDSVEEIEELLKRKRKEMATATKEYERLIQDYDERFGDEE